MLVILDPPTTGLRDVVDLRKVPPGDGSYVSESDHFEPNWAASFWGPTSGRLADVKRQYNPAGLFYVHHGVGSEE